MMNDAGQVVGWAEDTTSHPKAFLWEKGVMYNLSHLTVNLPGMANGPASSSGVSSSGVPWPSITGGVSLGLPGLTLRTPTC